MPASIGAPASPQLETSDFFHYVARTHLRTTITTVVLLLFAALAEGMSVMALFPAVTQMLREGQEAATGVLGRLQNLLEANGASLTLPLLAGIVFVGVTLKGLLTWVAMRRAGYVVADMEMSFRGDVMRRLFRAQWSLFVSAKTGRIVAGVSHEATTAAAAYGTACRVILRGLQLLIYVTIIALISPLLAVLSLAIGLLAVRASGGFFAVSKQAGSSRAQVSKDFNSRLVDTVFGIRAIRAMGAEDRFLARLNEDALKVNLAIKRNVDASEARAAAEEPFMVLGILLSLGIASQYLNLDTASISVLGFVFFRASIQLRLGLMEYQLLTNMLPMYDSLQELIVNISRNEEATLGDQEPPELTKGISVENINFKYESAQLFRDLSLEIPAGQMTVVVGPSGVGKTTLLDLIMALQRPLSGSIRIDDSSLLDIDIAKWRRCLGYVPQDSNLIHGSIFNNVTLGSESIDIKAVEEAIARAGAESFVSKLPEGVHADVGAHGSRLSAGQRQRIALARALVRKPRLLILDEVTAALDPVTAAEITTTLKSLCPGTTILAISHQKSLVEVADRVYEMKSGTIHRLAAEKIASFGEI